MSRIVDEPGVYEGISGELYHSDHDALSSSGARTLLRECPALFRWQQLHPETRDEFDFGHAAHAEVLGVGAPMVVPTDPETGEPWDRWQSNAAKAAVAEIRAAGGIPVKAETRAAVAAMADALRAHPLAGPLLTSPGRAELAGWWQDEHTGEWLRVMWDWITTDSTGRLVIVDYKTTTDASPEAAAKSSARYGYWMQDDWYRTAATALGVHPDPGFLLVMQSKTAPYLVSVHQHDPEDIAQAHQRNRDAIDLWHRCRQQDIWPAWEQVYSIEIPRWAR